MYRVIKGRLKYLSGNESTLTGGIGTRVEECGAEEEGREGELEGEGAYMDVRLFTLALTETSVVTLGGTCTGVCHSERGCTDQPRVTQNCIILQTFMAIVKQPFIRNNLVI